MNAKDLRIGNLVTINNPKNWPHLKDEPLKVIGIEFRKDVFFTESSHSVKLESAKIYPESYAQFDKFIEPIPLTEEWVIKFGLIENEYDSIIYYKTTVSTKGRKLPFFLQKCLNGSYSPMCYTDIHEEIKYVHQLQNLYFALTGTELELKTEI